ncbi:hypothetical protein G9A89_012507 [Geosiphon pyriformis]|nr:hypothetical protein G9A89_012507 [Geosiphon pyriformis]
MDGFLSGLSTFGMKAGAVVFFEDINLSLGVEVFELVSFTMAELQAIALALECVPLFHSIDLFSDNQAALDACKSESKLMHPNFRNWCWIKHCHIANVVFRGHSGVLGNEQADTFTGAAALSDMRLLHMINEHFLRAGGATVGSGFWVLVDSLHADALHHYLPVAVHKCLYNRSYSNIICLFCGNVEILDHVFSCLFDAAGCACLRLSRFSSCVSQLLSNCIFNVVVGAALCKSFVFNEWYRKSVAVFKDSKVVAQNIVAFVHEFCLMFYNDIWLVHAKHQTFIEKNGMISHNDSVLVSISGLPLVLLASMVRLLDIADAFGVGFGFHKFCLFFTDISDVVSVHIST